ncbi:MAG TPA: M48 family metalloprotease [Dongiaceae bacterium]|nr:M48 family metalloprotease [Dongiaceae bacterium]
MQRILRKRWLCRSVILLILAALVAWPARPPAEAAGDRGPSIIRDAEIETTIREFTDPVFVAAGLDTRAVHVYLLDVDDINAFVAGGMNVFIYTGLLIRTQRPNQLVGVVAHETGHIAGGHLARFQEALRNATIEEIIGAVLGGVAAGMARGGGAGILVGPGVATQSVLQYTRTMEASADAAAMTFLDRTHQSSRGLLEFFGILEQVERTLYGQQNPYLRNHPLTSDRIANVQAHVDSSPYSNVPDPPAWVVAHKRMVAKLVGYLWPLDQVLQRYPLSDKSLYARYARSIAYFRIGQLSRALPEIDSLIKEHPDDPYFQEQKGQILYESGHGREALAFYGKAVQLAPNQPLIRMELAQCQLEQNDPRLIPPAIQEMKQVVLFESDNPAAWRTLAIAYGKGGQEGMAALSLAEAAAANGDDKAARLEADRAIQQLPEGSPAWLRAQDILTTTRPQDNQGNGGIPG